MKVLGNIDVDLDVVNKDYVDGEIKNNLNNYVPLATYEDFTKTNDSRYNDFLKKIESKADKSHKHSISDINNLQTTLNSKASLMATTELFSELQTKLDSKASKNHTHTEYLEKGEPITLTAEQKAELKAELKSVQVWKGTGDEYFALESPDPNTLYLIKE